MSLPYQFFAAEFKRLSVVRKRITDKEALRINDIRLKAALNEIKRRQCNTGITFINSIYTKLKR